MAFPSLGNSGHVVVSVSIDFLSNSKQDTLFHCITYDYSHADWEGLYDHLGDAPWEDVFKLGASAAASEFCEWVQVVIDVYTSLCKYQIKPHSSPWFSAACAAAIIDRNHFFCLHQQNKSSESKVKFTWVSNHCNSVLEAAKLAYELIKQKSITSQKFGSCHFWQIATVFSTKVKLLYLLCSTAQRCCLVYLIKQKCLLKPFLGTQILMTEVSLYLFSFLASI